MNIRVRLAFVKGYIAHPYWPERERLINIQKQSGVNRVRSESAREKALTGWLKGHQLSLKDYRELEHRAARPFYTLADVNGVIAASPPPTPSPTPSPPPTSEIVIPAHQLHGMIAQACDLAPSSIRYARLAQVRTVMQWGDLRTGRYAPDGVWERFVAPKSGPGKALSNQRALRSDPYLTQCEAWGLLSIVQPEHESQARRFIEWAGAEIGVGACRKMGWGRFVVRRWEPEG